MEGRVYDFTMLDTFQTCRRKYYWMFEKHLQTKTKSPALVFGGAIHDALDAYYLEGSMEKGIQRFKESFEEREGESIRTTENGIKLLEYYAKVYAHEPFKVLGKPEKGFVFPIGSVLYGGRMDLPVEWDGAMWIMEHKTTSKLTSQYFSQFDLDKQVTGYVVGAEEYTGRTCLGCIINALEPWKQLIRPTAKSKRPEDHFVRCPKSRLKEHKERFKLNVQRLVRDIEWCRENDEWYEAEKKECCYYYNWDCPFKVLCMHGHDQRLIDREFKVEVWKPYVDAERKV